MRRRLSSLLRSATRLVLLATTAACSGGPTSPTPLDREFTLAPGSVARVEEAALAVRFIGVSGDSRCPADAVCVLGGDAIVRIVVEASAAAVEYELHTGDMRPIRHGEFTVALVRLDPYPFSARTIEPDEYRATLRVTR